MSAWGDQKDRRIGEVKDDGPQAAVEYFQQKYEDFKSKIQDLINTIEGAENKGSYLMKLLHLKDQLLVHEGLGDYPALQVELTKYEELLSAIIQKNRERNTEIKTALLEEMKEAVQIINWQESTDKVQDIKTRWLKTGNASDGKHEELEAEFWGIVEKYFDKKKAFYEDKKKLSDHRKNKYLAIIDKTDELEHLRGKERFDKVKELKAEWGAVGNIPAREFKELSMRFNNRLKGKKELPPPDFDRISDRLSQMYNREIPIDKDLLQQYRKSLGGFKTRDPEQKEKRHQVMQQINIIWERDFLENLAGKKHRGFDTKSESEKNEILKRLLSEFIRRDKEDLKQYEENSMKFAGHDQNTNRLLERKLGQQRNKIMVKEKLLGIINSALG